MPATHRLSTKTACMQTVFRIKPYIQHHVIISRPKAGFVRIPAIPWLKTADERTQAVTRLIAMDLTGTTPQLAETVYRTQTFSKPINGNRPIPVITQMTAKNCLTRTVAQLEGTICRMQTLSRSITRASPIPVITQRTAKSFLIRTAAQPNAKS